MEYDDFWITSPLFIKCIVAPLPQHAINRNVYDLIYTNLNKPEVYSVHVDNLESEEDLSHSNGIKSSARSNRALNWAFISNIIPEWRSLSQISLNYRVLATIGIYCYPSHESDWFQKLSSGEKFQLASSIASESFVQFVLVVPDDYDCCNDQCNDEDASHNRLALWIHKEQKLVEIKDLKEMVSKISTKFLDFSNSIQKTINVKPAHPLSNEAVSVAAFGSEPLTSNILADLALLLGNFSKAFSLYSKTASILDPKAINDPVSRILALYGILTCVIFLAPSNTSMLIPHGLAKIANSDILVNATRTSSVSSDSAAAKNINGVSTTYSTAKHSSSNPDLLRDMQLLPEHAFDFVTAIYDKIEELFQACFQKKVPVVPMIQYIATYLRYASFLSLSRRSARMSDIEYCNFRSLPPEAGAVTRSNDKSSRTKILQILQTVCNINIDPGMVMLRIKVYEAVANIAWHAGCKRFAAISIKSLINYLCPVVQRIQLHEASKLGMHPQAQSDYLISETTFLQPDETLVSNAIQTLEERLDNRGWPILLTTLAHQCAEFSVIQKDYEWAISCVSKLLGKCYDYLHRTEQVKHEINLQKLIVRAKGVNILYKAQFYNLKLLQNMEFNISQRFGELVEQQAKNSKDRIRREVFLYQASNKINNYKVSDAEKSKPITEYYIVAHEECQITLEFYNPYSYELRFQSIEIVTDPPKQIELTIHSQIIPPFTSHTIQACYFPSKIESFKVLGCLIKVTGFEPCFFEVQRWLQEIVHHPISRSLSNKFNSIIETNDVVTESGSRTLIVLPPQPSIQLSLEHPRLELYQHETRDFSIILKNVSNYEANYLRIELDSQYELQGVRARLKHDEALPENISPHSQITLVYEIKSSQLYPRLTTFNFQCWYAKIEPHMSKVFLRKYRQPLELIVTEAVSLQNLSMSLNIDYPDDYTINALVMSHALFSSKLNFKAQIELTQEQDGHKETLAVATLDPNCTSLVSFPKRDFDPESNVPITRLLWSVPERQNLRGSFRILYTNIDTRGQRAQIKIFDTQANIPCPLMGPNLKSCNFYHIYLELKERMPSWKNVYVGFNVEKSKNINTQSKVPEEDYIFWSAVECSSKNFLKDVSSKPGNNASCLVFIPLSTVTQPFCILEAGEYLFKIALIVEPENGVRSQIQFSYFVLKFD